MDVEPDIAGTAALFGDAVRAAMLIALLDKRFLSAGELAFAANVSPQTASFHLAKLTSAELLKGERRGRHQVYRLAGPAVASVIESLAAISPLHKNVRLRAEDRFHSEGTRQLAAARTCYDHLAGRAAVLFHDVLLKSGYLVHATEKEYAITNKGRVWLETLDINSNMHEKRSPFARPCLDWTERRPHLAGRLAAQLLAVFLDRGWIARISDTRAVRITERGFLEFERQYGLNLRASRPPFPPA